MVPAASAPDGGSSRTWLWVALGSVAALFGGGTCCVGGIVALGLMGESAATTARLDDGPSRGRGNLDHGDRTDTQGRRFDTYAFEVGSGDRVTIELSSRDFDTLLRIGTPSGGSMEHDDIDYPSNTNSRIDLPSTEAGAYTVHVTSFQRGIDGPYVVSVHR